MRLTLAVLALVSTPALFAAYDYQTISGASEGVIVSREINYVEHTYIAYRDASGSLAVARFMNGFFVPSVVWTNMPPSNTSINVSKTGTVLVSFWSGFKYRYAMSVAPGVGNCGPANDWRCGDVLLPPEMTATAQGTIHGDVDSTSRAHFVYAFRQLGRTPTLNGVYYRSRTFSGLWSDSNSIYGPGPTSFSNQLPTAVYVSSTVPTVTLHFSSYGGGKTYAGRSDNLPFTPFWIVDDVQTTNTAFGSAEHAPYRSIQELYCEVTQSAPAIVRVTQRSPYTYYWFGTGTVYSDSQAVPPTARCSISQHSYGAAIGFTTTQGVVRVLDTQGPSFLSGWYPKFEDASSTFSKVSVGYNFHSGDIRILYHGPGFIKLAIEQ
ncbi:MAG: hypothetical protein FJW32_08110 [Acidobacteria bacterium]|nr:hypothetical protein [Acidobacteriota bacterium]